MLYFNCVPTSLCVGNLSCGTKVLARTGQWLCGLCPWIHFVIMVVCLTAWGWVMSSTCSLLLFLSLPLLTQGLVKIPSADAHTLKVDFLIPRPIRNKFQLLKKNCQALEIFYRNVKQTKTITECLFHKRNRIWPKVQGSNEDLPQELLRV